MTDFCRREFEAGVCVKRLAELVAACLFAARNTVDEREIFVRLGLIDLCSKSQVQRDLKLPCRIPIGAFFVASDGLFELRFTFAWHC